MFKKLILIAFLLAFVLSQFVGGYNPVDLTNIEATRTRTDIQIAQRAARKQYLKTSNGKSLGEVQSVSTQVVSGINYKFLFASPQGNVEVIVFRQPWTDTTEVTSITNISN